MARNNISTQEVLLSTAEQLFAEQGFASVSLRQIRIAAGQKNESALHYYFGSREGLLEAILRPYCARVDDRREEMIDSLTAKRRISPEALIEIYVLPYADLLDQGQPFRYFLRIRANLFSDPTVSIPELHRLEGTRLRYPDLRLVRLAQRAFPHVPPVVLHERTEIAQFQAMQALAFRAATIDSSSAHDRPVSNAAYVANLVDMYCGAVGFPPSPRLLSALAADEQRPGPEAGSGVD